jgi:prepilin-type N-terminal cleavage/methylation domain-containing protein
MYAPRAPRRGFTLPEMLIALVLFSLVGGSILMLVSRQQRFYRSAAEVIRVQGQLRQGGNGLPLDVRGISTADPNTVDIYARSDASIDFRRVFGSSMICSKPAVNVLMIYPAALTSGPPLTTWAHQPQVGDSLFVLDEGKLPLSTADDVWRIYEVRSVAASKGNKGCPWKTATDPGALLEVADTVRSSYRVGLDRNHDTYVHVGTPVRFFRRVRYQSFVAGDGQWYLGYSDCLKTYATASLCSDPTPISGPYEPQVGNTSQNGIVFTYFDSSGTALASTAPSSSVSRVDVVLRAASATAVARTGSGPMTTHRESVLLSIGIRNIR